MQDQTMDLDTLQGIMESVPFHQLFRIEILHTDAPDELRMRLRNTPEIARSAGSGQIHGGVLATLGDIAGAFVVGRMTGSGGVTMHLSVDFMRPATKTDVIAIARVRRLTRTSAFVDIDIFDDEERPVVACRGIYAVARK